MPFKLQLSEALSHLMFSLKVFIIVNETLIKAIKTLITHQITPKDKIISSIAKLNHVLHENQKKLYQLNQLKY